MGEPGVVVQLVCDSVARFAGRKTQRQDDIEKIARRAGWKVNNKHIRRLRRAEGLPSVGVVPRCELGWAHQYGRGSMDEFGAAPRRCEYAAPTIEPYVRPRWDILLASLVLSLAAAVLVLVHGKTGSALGYMAAVLGLLGLVAFRFVNRLRQMDRNYLPDPRAGLIAVATLVASVASMIVHAYRLAQRLPV